ncbi:MAG: penicillin-binding transpeptidase domain-containing protein [Actinomycetota bacterium]|nr:penicillin-binding transpeptidase domain-containing protein [Actinomycetota bacterium]
MNKRIRRLTITFIVALTALALNLGYLQALAAQRIASHPRNTRGLEKELSIERGLIISADGQVLAENEERDSRYYRHYPAGDLTAHLVGFNNIKYGRSDLEARFNDLLLGRKGVTSLEDYFHRIIEEEPGNDLILTIDLEIQRKAAQALGNRRGAVVALDPKTGAILAMVTYPRYDPNRLDETWEKINRDTSSPLLNRATQGLYPPGSSFKVITASAALEEKICAPSSIYDGPKELQVHGSKVTNYRDQGYGIMTFKEAFEVSCNTIFAQVGLQLGAEGLVKSAQGFGLNRAVPFELPTKESQIPTAGEMDPVMLAWSAVGQGKTLVTPLQMALVTSAVANDGVIMKPFVVKEARDYKGQSIKSTPLARPWARAISRETAETVADLMVGVVEHGTGKAAQIPGVRVAGKTGTAESIKGKKTHAWFVAFAPADDPQLVVAVVVEHGGTGGKVAAPIAREVIEATLGR